MPVTGNIEIFADLHAAGRRAAELVVAAAREAVEARGTFSIALSGGSTPVVLFRMLAEAPFVEEIPWERTHVYWADERCVPPDDPRSNYRLARETLLAKVAIPPEQVHRVAGEDPDPDRAATDYARQLPERLDLLLLGMGADGHVASLFPRSPALKEATRRAVAVTAPAAPPCRITITPPVIAAARRLLVLVASAEKAPAVARALRGTTDVAACPACLARRGTWLLDRAAAGETGAREAS